MLKAMSSWKLSLFMLYFFTNSALMLDLDKMTCLKPINSLSQCVIVDFQTEAETWVTWIWTWVKVRGVYVGGHFCVCGAFLCMCGHFCVCGGISVYVGAFLPYTLSLAVFTFEFIHTCRWLWWLIELSTKSSWVNVKGFYLLSYSLSTKRPFT